MGKSGPVSDLIKALAVLSVAIKALDPTAPPLEYLRALTVAVGGGEVLLQRLRMVRDGQIASCARRGYGYKQIGRAADMSASRASRIAREIGAPPRTAPPDERAL